MNEIIVVKIGTSTLSQDNEQLDYSKIVSIINDINTVQNEGYKVIIVTSGAVLAGKFHNLVLKGIPKSQKAQFYFSIGQSGLINFYSNTFTQLGKIVAPLLISRESFANRVQYFSIRDTIRNLIANNIIPIISDNNILHSDNYNFSDNDHLAAYIGGMINVDKVIFLTDVNGIYKDYPKCTKKGLIKEITDNFDEVEKFIKDCHKGTGGMKSKLNAARLLYYLGISSFVTSGPVDKIVLGEYNCTRFIPKEKVKISGIRKWLCTGAIPKGTIVASPLGADVIRSSKERGSLLSKGILEVKGLFNNGDVVSICDENTRLLGYGITKYSSNEITSLLNEEGIIVVHADYFYGTDFGYFN